MIRELKFRAWDRERQEMYEVDALHFHRGLIEVDNEFDHQTTSIEPYNVMQYTGLKDRNGEEIYEGDILRYWGGYYEVSFSGAAFGWIEDGIFFAFAELPLSEIGKTEIAGNIHEHPHLLEVE